MRLRFSTAIMGDSRPTSSHLGRILGFKPNYAGNDAVG
jgi:hypothetical protein